MSAHEGRRDAAPDITHRNDGAGLRALGRGTVMARAGRGRAVGFSRPRGWTAATLAGVLAGAAALGGAGIAVAAGGAPLPAVAASAEAPANVALLGTPEASYTASWHAIDAVNDGEVAHTGSYDKAWATWDGNRPATQWLEYAWEAPVRVDRSVLSFWSDGEGANGDNVRVPGSWRIQYWDETSSTYKDVVNPSAYGTARLAPNETTFEPVTTTKVRATFDALKGATVATYSAVGVTEWELWGTGGTEEPEPVDPNAPIDVSPVHVPTLVGELPDLPEDVDAIYEDGRVASVAVDWADVTAEQVAEKGSFGVTGVAAGVVEPVQGTVYVRDGEPGDVTEVDYVSVVTLAGTAPVLPANVTAAFEDGSRDSRTGVEWDAVEPSQYAEAGDLFFVEGDVEGTDLPAEATVFVVAPDDAEDSIAPTVFLSVEPGPATSGWYVEPVRVTVAASDNRDPAPAVEVSVDGGEWAAYTGPVTVDTDGVRTVAARATDASGNVGEATRELKVDATAPVTVATVKNLGSSVEVTLTATDAGSGVDRIQWEGPGTFWGTYQEPFTRALTEEPQVIEFAATDAAGNQEVRQRIELPALGEPAEDLEVEVSATARCVAGKVTVSVRAVNGEDVPVDVKVASAFGAKSFTGVAPGKSASQSFATRAGSVDAGAVTVTASTGGADGTSATFEAPYAALDCG
ncbi:OmpL47-type beta-barrel domain-containing protein [Oerskovia enterophila]